MLGVSELSLDLYRSLGLRALYHGDEAVVDTAAFSLDGRAIRKVRQSVHRLGGAGYVARALRPSELDATMRERLEEVARTWRGDAPERGFMMACDALFSLGDDDAVFVVGFDRRGQPMGFLHFAISRPGCALSLSIDAAAARRAERLHRVADLRVDRVGARPRLPARVA